MKINKLLLFLLALASLNSCVEYVDNGVIPPGPEKPEERLYAAEVANPEEAKYVGDKFEFKATLNGVDVTKSSKFKVNGVATTNNASFYIPHKTGSHSVIATMDDYEATFKFTVLEKDEEEPEPEPTGNRIEYGGKSYPVSETIWALAVDTNNKIMVNPINGIDYSIWIMQTAEFDTNDKIVNLFATIVFVPFKNATTIAFPNDAPSAIIDAKLGGVVTINGVDVLDKVTNSTYTFASTSTSSGQDVFTVPQPWAGTANYTATATGAGGSAELFWNGSYEAFAQKMGAKSVKTININNLKDLDIKKLKNLNETQIKNLKIAK